MIEIEPVAWVRAERTDLEDDYWGGAISRIELAEGLDPQSLVGLEEFSHAEVIFHFDRVAPDRIVRGARHPRGNTDWPAVGIFAQRGKNRPNRLGSTVVRVVSVEGRVLVVEGLDAIDGTPVVDIKPVMREFLPHSDVRQPEWAGELMRHYWDARR
jgi:tRNA-Thr(GGU) m(6)t(6)A37 methyltransferase TsaA